MCENVNGKEYTQLEEVLINATTRNIVEEDVLIITVMKFLRKKKHLESGILTKSVIEGVRIGRMPYKYAIDSGYFPNNYNTQLNLVAVAAEPYGRSNIFTV
jgi:hypothetical protein